MHTKWLLPACIGAQQDPSVQYQRPLCTAPWNTWRRLRTVSETPLYSAEKHMETPPYNIRDPSVQRREIHGDPSVQYQRHLSTAPRNTWRPLRTVSETPLYSAEKHMEAPPYSIRDSSVQRREIHGDPFVQYQRPLCTAPRNTWRPLRIVSETPLYSAEKHMETPPHGHFHRTTSISWPFSPRSEVHAPKCDTFIHKVPIQDRKRQFADGYPIYHSLGAKTGHWEMFAMLCHEPKHVHILWKIEYRDYLVIQR